MCTSCDRTFWNNQGNSKVQIGKELKNNLRVLNVTQQQGSNYSTSSNNKNIKLQENAKWKEENWTIVIKEMQKLMNISIWTPWYWKVLSLKDYGVVEIYITGALPLWETEYKRKI